MIHHIDEYFLTFTVGGIYGSLSLEFINGFQISLWLNTTFILRWDSTFHKFTETDFTDHLDEIERLVLEKRL